MTIIYKNIYPYKGGSIENFHFIIGTTTCFEDSKRNKIKTLEDLFKNLNKNIYINNCIVILKEIEIEVGKIGRRYWWFADWNV